MTTMSEWAAREIAETLEAFCCALSDVTCGDNDIWPWSRDGFARVEQISWQLAAYSYAHAEQLRRYREIVEAETAKYEAALRDLQGRTRGDAN